jgi:hypothetical protein
LGKEWYFNTNPGIYLPYQKLNKIVQGEQQSIVEMLNTKAEKYRSLGLPLLAPPLKLWRHAVGGE